MSMSDKFEFAGTVVRVEGDGFGVVRFDSPHSANTHGYFSGSTMTSVLPLAHLKPGTHVFGTAVSSTNDFAEVKTIKIGSPVQ
jgi:hypothetical protein